MTLVASSWGLGRDVWVDPFAPKAVDSSSWCFVPVGDPQFPALAAHAKLCAEYGQVLVRRGGEPEQFGALVRHWALAERLNVGSDADTVDVVNPLVQLASEDRCALAVAGPARLAAAIISVYGFATVEWAQAMAVATASGTDPVLAARRVPVFAALNAARTTVTADELELWDGHAVEHGVAVVVLAIRAGYTASEITPEQLADPTTLAVAAALNGYAGTVNA